MAEFFSKILDKFSGFDFWLVVVLILIGLAGWYYLGRRTKTAKRQLLFATMIAMMAVSESPFIIC